MLILFTAAEFTPPRSPTGWVGEANAEALSNGIESMFSVWGHDLDGVAGAVSAAPAAHKQVSSIAAAPQATAVVNCCASAWYPWGYYPSYAKCAAAGKKTVAKIAVAIAWKCTAARAPNVDKYQLWIAEIT